MGEREREIRGKCVYRGRRERVRHGSCYFEEIKRNYISVARCAFFNFSAEFSW